MQFSQELESRFAELVTHYPQGRQRAALIPMLLFAQDEVGSITREVVEEIAGRLGISTLQVDEVVSYYSMLRREPVGKYHFQVCTNISCLLLGGEELLNRIKTKIGVEEGQVTDDGLFSVEHVECLGACSWAPAMQVNYDYHHFVTPEKVERLIDDLRKVQ
jgi:NADH-quinone oxidoreductase subunit E